MSPDLKWLARFEPRYARAVDTKLYWYEEPRMLVIEPPKVHQAAGKPFIALDLTDVEVVIDFDPEARQFFLDLACWLLFRCVEGEFSGL